MNSARRLFLLAIALLSASSLHAQDEVLVVPGAEPSPLERFWINATLDVGWTKSQRVPVALLPGQTFDAGSRLGFSIAGGVWLNEEQSRGIDSSLFVLGEGTNEYSLFLPSERVVFVPVRGVRNGRPLGFQLSGTDVGIGSFQALAETNYQTFDLNYRHTLLRDDSNRVDMIAGYRYAHVSEGLHLYSKRMGGDGFLIRTKDHIHACNQFNGGQIGLFGEMIRGPWFFNATGKIAFGAMSSETNLEGAIRVNERVEPFGFYSRPAVRGERHHTNFAVMPTLNLVAGRQLTEHLRMFVGYNFQYLNRVIRPADIFDPLPTFSDDGGNMARDHGTSDFWVQSVNLGFEWRY